MYRTDLSGVNLYRTDLSGARLHRAKFLNAVLINCKLSNVEVDADTDFHNSVIYDPDFLNTLREIGSRNIPDEIKNKQGLREGLLRTNLDEKTIDLYLRNVTMP